MRILVRMFRNLPQQGLQIHNSNRIQTPKLLHIVAGSPHREQVVDIIIKRTIFRCRCLYLLERFFRESFLNIVPNLYVDCVIFRLLHIVKANVIDYNIPLFRIIKFEKPVPITAVIVFLKPVPADLFEVFRNNCTVNFIGKLLKTVSFEWPYIAALSWKCIPKPCFPVAAFGIVVRSDVSGRYLSFALFPKVRLYPRLSNTYHTCSAESRKTPQAG